MTRFRLGAPCPEFARQVLARNPERLGDVSRLGWHARATQYLVPCRPLQSIRQAQQTRGVREGRPARHLRRPGGNPFSGDRIVDALHQEPGKPGFATGGE
jgi:hypothetical protein